MKLTFPWKRQHRYICYFLAYLAVWCGGCDLVVVRCVLVVAVVWWCVLGDGVHSGDDAVVVLIWYQMNIFLGKKENSFFVHIKRVEKRKFREIFMIADSATQRTTFTQSWSDKLTRQHIYNIMTNIHYKTSWKCSKSSGGWAQSLMIWSEKAS